MCQMCGTCWCKTFSTSSFVFLLPPINLCLHQLHSLPFCVREVILLFFSLSCAGWSERLKKEEAEMGRAPCCDKANVKKGPWSPEEDAKLKSFIEQHGTGGNWIALPQKIGLKRCGKSCRLRWLNYLRPNIKHGGFSEEEDNIICSLYISIGSRWSIIAAQLPGRTDNDIKNYWNTRLKKKLLGRRRESQSRRANQEPKQGINHMDYINNASTAPPCTTNSSTLQPLNPSALERMQLHFQLQTHPFPLINPQFWSQFQMPGGKVFQNNTSDTDVSEMNEDDSIPISNSTTTQMQTQVVVDGFFPNSFEFEQTHLNQVLENRSSACIDQYDNSFNGFSSSSSIGFDGGCNSMDQSVMSKLNSVEQSNMNFQVHSDFPAGLDDLLYCKTGSSMEKMDQQHGLDSINEVSCATRENIAWWANGFEPKFSLNPWETTTLIDPERCHEKTLQEYVLQYDL